MKNLRMIKVGLVQQANAGDVRQNMERLASAIRQCARDGADLVVLQELHSTLYFCQVEAPGHFDLAETIPGPSTEFFGGLAKDLRVLLIISLFEKRAPGIYHNTALVLEKDGSIAGKYRKMHIPDDPGYYEKFYFTPGDLGFEPIATSLGKLGVLICWDQWFPEAARLMALKGAELLIYPTAIGWDAGESAHTRERHLRSWIISQQAHAIANSLPVVAVNRTGREANPSQQSEGIQFWGNSFAADPQGQILYQAPAEEEAVHVVSLDLDRSERVRRVWPFFRDRRIDHYQGLISRFLD
jgi:N-carbamoylputrescine amidase